MGTRANNLACKQEDNKKELCAVKKPAQEAKACEDRRITRSKLALKSALISMMEEKGFENVTVNDLCAKAGLNRGTFYNHFKTKEDLLWALEDEIMDDLVTFQEEMRKVSLTSLSFYVISKKPLPFFGFSV